MQTTALFTDSSPGGRLRLLGPMTIPSLLGREVEDQAGLSLTKTPAYIVRQERAGGPTCYLVILGETLGRRALMDLLFTLAPYKAHGPDRFGRVLDNWRLHDRALTSSASMSLFLQHVSSLKLSWQVFARHRELFIAIFQDETEETRALPVITWERSPEGARRWQFDALEPSLVQALESLIPILRDTDRAGRLEPEPLIGLATVPYFLPELRKNWRPWQPLVRDGKSNYIGPASIPVLALMHRRVLLNSLLIRSAEQRIDQTDRDATPGFGSIFDC